MPDRLVVSKGKGKGREGKGREGKGREGKGREGEEGVRQPSTLPLKRGSYMTGSLSERYVQEQVVTYNDKEG